MAVSLILWTCWQGVWLKYPKPLIKRGVHERLEMLCTLCVAAILDYRHFGNAISHFPVSPVLYFQYSVTTPAPFGVET